MAQHPEHGSVPPQWNRRGFTSPDGLPTASRPPEPSRWFLPAVIFSSAVTVAFLLVASGILATRGGQQQGVEPPASPEPTGTAPSPDPTTRSPQASPTPESPEPSSKKPRKKEKPPHLRKQRGRQPVPLPPGPDSTKEASVEIAKNSFYRERASTKRCSGLPNESAFPYGSVSNKTWKRVAQKMADCARNIWVEPVAEAGYQATKVRVEVFSGSVDTPCGGGQNAPGLYCSSNQVIYLNKDGGGGGHPSEYHWAWYLMTMAHEYGHHVQARTGILTASWRWQQSQRNQDDYWRVNRRLELQANCLGGMALRRTSALSHGVFEAYASRMTGEKVHGSRKNQYHWYRTGWAQTKASHCNTYRASGGKVS